MSERSFASERHGNAKISEGKVELIVRAVAHGSYLETAAALAGIERRTLHRWIKRGQAELDRMESEDSEPLDSEELYADLCLSLTRARGDAAAKDIAIIRAAGNAGEWRASAWLLERRDPDRWGRGRRRIVEHGGDSGGRVRFVEAG